MTVYVVATYLKLYNKELTMPSWLESALLYAILIVSLWSLYNHDYPAYP